MPIHYKKKSDLTGRLLEKQFELDLIESEEEDSKEAEESSEEEEYKDAHPNIVNLEGKMANNFSFQDVENPLDSFDGESTSVVDWLAQFEEVSTVFSWTDFQKLLYARRLLKGAAKLAVETSTKSVSNIFRN